MHLGTSQVSEESQDAPMEVPKTFYLTWKDISYTVAKKRIKNSAKEWLVGGEVERVRLLHEVSGVVKSGTIVAIMGPSGAGKTTLLATIAQRVKGESRGKILLNGQLLDKETMARMSGFVPQVDLAVESLTVQEHMEFMARMKMDRRFRALQRKHRIHCLLTDLGLLECGNSRLSSLSGGERKRVSLAVQLLTEPSILFCDEPTTGLDSYSAMSVAKTLRDVAARDRVVICTVHQPASGLLDLFHEVLLLRAGRVAFQGTVSDANEFFASLDLHCPATFNRAEFYVSQLSLTRESGEKSYEKVKYICEDFERSEFGKKLAMAIADSCAVSICPEMLHPIFLEKVSSVSGFKRIRPFTQIEWLAWRSYVDSKRNLMSLFVRSALYIGISVLISTPFVGITENLDQKNIQNMQGLMYLVITETVFTFNYGAFYTFPRELPFLLRDMASGLYDPAPYYVSKVIILTPGTIVLPFIYAAVIFNVAGLNGGFLGFVYFLIPIILGAMSATALGCLMSAVFESISGASLLSVPIDFLTLIFSGVFLHLGSLPPFTSWLKYTSQFYYGGEAVSLLQWSEIRHIDCPADPEGPCVSTGLEVLEKYGFQPGNYPVDLIGLFALYSVGHFVGYLCIRLRSQKEPVY
ncbi:protein scarlet isoform X1 [Orussus abietinus]|uniref:protein scarlet isoform X1 n=2 Tax=Orussus abietinus TaxID=222816 RepID=UPI0006268D52|nr:protein scarlet isoform X1 [Orussus abietinus]